MLLVKITVNQEMRLAQVQAANARWAKRVTISDIAMQETRKKYLSSCCNDYLASLIVGSVSESSLMRLFWVARRNKLYTHSW
jgi:hypothetical protein